MRSVVFTSCFANQLRRDTLKMDVYGYHTFPYDQSDELAKQMFAQQALASSLPFQRDVPEPHAMPSPSGAPWNVQGMPWGLPSPPQLVQFTAQQDPEPKQLLHCKRKNLDIEPVVPAKQLITEEKMAAHLNGLHISSDYTAHTIQSEELMDMSVDTPTLSEKLKGHRLVLSDELTKIRDEPLIPASLLERLEKPQMSLVVWKPKEDILNLKDLKEDDETNQEEQVKRKGLLVAEPGMDIEM